MGNGCQQDLLTAIFINWDDYIPTCVIQNVVQKNHNIIIIRSQYHRNIALQKFSTIPFHLHNKNIMKLRKNIAISEAGLLFNPVTGESFSINPIGVEILNMIRADKSQDEISAVLLARYTTDRTTVENDYQDFIGLLSHNHLLERHDEKDA
jgi:hypothetical protein